jgi:hypothetical protein
MGTSAPKLPSSASSPNIPNASFGLTFAVPELLLVPPPPPPPNISPSSSPNALPFPLLATGVAKILSLSKPSVSSLPPPPNMFSSSSPNRFPKILPPETSLFTLFRLLFSIALLLSLPWAPLKTSLPSSTPLMVLVALFLPFFSDVIPPDSTPLSLSEKFLLAGVAPPSSSLSLAEALSNLLLLPALPIELALLLRLAVVTVLDGVAPKGASLPDSLPASSSDSPPNALTEPPEPFKLSLEASKLPSLPFPLGALWSGSRGNKRPMLSSSRKARVPTG